VSRGGGGKKKRANFIQEKRGDSASLAVANVQREKKGDTWKSKAGKLGWGDCGAGFGGGAYTSIAGGPDLWERRGETSSR